MGLVRDGHPAGIFPLTCHPTLAPGFFIAHCQCQGYSVCIMRLTIGVLLLLWLCCTAVAEKVPSDAWQTGTLKDSSESWHSRSAGTINGNAGYGVHGAMVSREYPIIEYTIETNTYTYEANLVLKHANDKQPPVTVNGPIKFAIVKSDFYIQDEQGKEHKLVLVKKTLKATSQ